MQPRNVEVLQRLGQHAAERVIEIPESERAATLWKVARMLAQAEAFQIRMGDQMRYERERLGISQVKLAQLSGVHRKTIINIEQGWRYQDTTILILSYWLDRIERGLIPLDNAKTEAKTP